jgi:anti-sigma factor RsiW
MCDKELLLGYLYDELPASDRQAFDRHLASCADCREEVSGLRGTRTRLTSWAPPEPDLGFEIVRSARPAPARWWRASPAWGLAAAAVLTLAAAAAIANIDIRVGGDGVVVQTGWNRPAASAPAQGAIQSALTATELSELQQRLEARVKDLESQLASRQAAAPVAANTGRMSDADLKLVRQLVNESEQRQQSELALRILQVNRDTEAARRADVDRLLAAYRQLQGTNFETSQRQKALEDHFMRVGLQR